MEGKKTTPKGPPFFVLSSLQPSEMVDVPHCQFEARIPLLLTRLSQKTIQKSEQLMFVSCNDAQTPLINMTHLA